jgi:hypothetical protein
MKEEPIFEIIIDGEVIEEINGWEKLDEVESLFIETIGKGYEQLYQTMGGSHGLRLFFNENTLKTTTFAYREFTGFVDKNGDRVYNGDRLANEWSECTYALNEYPDGCSKTGYYMRSGNNWAEIPITGKEIKKDYTVVHCVFPEIVNNNVKKKNKK